jgi:hypothetical protein
MSRISVTTIAFLLLLSLSARAATTEVPVPGLIGHYPISPSVAMRSVSFTLPAVPNVISSVTLRITGTQAMGHLVCPLGTFQDWPMLFEGSLQQDDDHWWLSAYVASSDGSFTQTFSFEPSPPEGASWEFLLDGAGVVNLYGAPNFLEGPCWEDAVQPTAEIIGAVLVIEGDITLATEPSTWGKIKSLYRK